MLVIIWGRSGDHIALIEERHQFDQDGIVGAQFKIFVETGVRYVAVARLGSFLVFSNLSYLPFDLRERCSTEESPGVFQLRCRFSFRCRRFCPKRCGGSSSC